MWFSLDSHAGMFTLCTLIPLIVGSHTVWYRVGFGWTGNLFKSASEIGRWVGIPGVIFAIVALLEVVIGMRPSGKHRNLLRLLIYIV